MKRMLAMLLAMAMVVTMLPVPAFADDTDEEIEVTEAVEETTEATQPEETEVPAEPEMVPEETEETVPEETEAPAETEEPEETLPEETEEPDAVELEEIGEKSAMDASTVASGTCGANLIWLLDDEGTLTISGTGAMDDYLPYEAPWFSRYGSVKTAVIEDGVTSIGTSSFSDCINLVSIIIPDSVTSIGNDAFYYCSGLTSARIPDSVTSIGDCVFFSCSSLTSVTIPDSVTSIGSETFGHCSNLTSVRIPDSVTSIGNYAFNFCSSLTSITIPNSVTSIGHQVFYECSSLTSIAIPNSVTSIGEDAFCGCSSLESVTIGSGVTSIDRAVFSECSSLESVTIPNSVTSIRKAAFYNCSSLKEIYFSGNKPSIESNAFYGVTATAYYPAGNATYANAGNYQGRLTWKPYCYAHSYVGTVTAPTCTEGGYTTYICSACSDSYVDDCTPAVGHSYNAVVTVPTCTEEGYTTYICSVCGDSYADDRTSAVGHSYNAVVTAPTCTEEGYITYTCSVCGDRYVDDRTPAAGHSYNAVVTVPTCTEKGYTTYTCSVCGSSYVADETEVTSHSYEEQWKYNAEGHWHECIACGAATQHQGHVPDRQTAIDQSIKACSVCGYEYDLIVISGPDQICGGASGTYKTAIYANSKLNWSLRSRDAAFASINAAGKLTTKAVAEPVEIVITASLKTNTLISAAYTVQLLPTAESVSIRCEDAEIVNGVISKNLLKGKTLQLSATAEPAAADQSGTWKSSAAKVASVDANGRVTFLKAGTVKITFTAAGNKKTASVTIVGGEPMKNLSISGVLVLTSGSKATLTAEYTNLPTVKTVTWESSNPDVAAVTAKGVVTAKTVYEEKTVTITAKATDGSGETAEHVITVMPKPTALAIRDADGRIVNDQTAAVDKANNDFVLTAPEGTNWKSSKTSIATVDNGVVHFLKAGSVVITAKSADGKQTGKVTLKMSSLVKTMTITNGTNFTLTSGKGKVTLKTSVNPDASLKTVTWTSSDPSVASVTSAGAVTAKAGVLKDTEVIITATAKDGSGVTAQATIKVIPAATAVHVVSVNALTCADGMQLRARETLNGRTIVLPVSRRFSLGAKVFPNALGAHADQTVTWKSSSAKIAQVDANGVVTALKAGTVTITVKTADGKTNTVKIKFV